MRYLLVLTTLLFTLNTAKAQLSGQAKIDSLLKELPKMKEDTNGVKLYSIISYEYSLINANMGVQYGEKGLELAKKINWGIGLSKCYNSLGINYIQKKEFKIGIENYFKALELSYKFKDKKVTTIILNNIANAYKYQSEYPKALEVYLEALKINEIINNKTGIANNLGDIAHIYSILNKDRKALEYFYKALGVFRELKDKIKMALILGDIGNIYKKQLNFSEAINYVKESLKICKDINYKFGISTNMMNLGTCYSANFEYDKAFECYTEALNTYVRLNNKNGIATCKLNIGSLYLKIVKDSSKVKNELHSKNIFMNEMKINKAIVYLNQSFEILSHENKKLELIYALDNLSQAHELKGDYKNALKYYKESKKINDSIFSSENQTKIANLEAKRENELKEKEIVILKKEKENEKLQRYAMFGGITGLGIIIGLILIQRRKSEKLLLNVLPAKIAKRLKAKEHPIADHFDGASIIFIDIVGFTSLSSEADPKRVVSVLNDIFTKFDKLADKHGLDKIKTIGDAYMAVAGIPEIQTDHAKRTAQMALDIKYEMKDFRTSDGTEIKFRIGIDCGAVVAGVIGEKKFIYDLWSDAVNTASRMESTGESGQIQITDNFKTELEKFDGNWNFTLRGEFEIKGKGLMKTYYLGN